MRETFCGQKVLPRTPFQKTFFRWGRWSPPLDGGERTTARGPGKQKEEGIVAFLFLFLVCMACLAYAAYLYGCPVQNKNAEGRVPSAFLFWAQSSLSEIRICLGLFCRGTGNGAVRRRTGESILLHKARWEEDGGFGEGGTFAREPATEGGRRPCPLRRRELRASTAGQGLSFPQKNLLTCGRSAEEARRGSCGLRPACGRRG